MQRELQRLRRVGELFDADFKRTLGATWSVTVSDGPVVTVTDGHRTESVLLDNEVDLENWPQEAWSEQYRDHTLDDDASESLAGEIFEVARLWNVSFPSCPEHASTLVDVCSMTWTCPGPPAHDIAPVGHLGA